MAARCPEHGWAGADVMRRDGIAALEFDDRHGYGPLRATIAHVLASQGVQAQADSVLVTSGSQQALILVAQILLKPGDVVLTVADADRLSEISLFPCSSRKVIQHGRCSSGGAR